MRIERKKQQSKIEKTEERLKRERERKSEEKKLKQQLTRRKRTQVVFIRLISFQKMCVASGLLLDKIKKETQQTHSRKVSNCLSWQASWRSRPS